MKKKILIVALVLAVLGGGVYWYMNSSGSSQNDEKIVLSKIEGKSDLMGYYQKVKELQAKLAADPKNEVGYWVSIAFEWKSMGDMSGDQYFYGKAMELYKQGIAKYGNTNIPFYWNAGKVSELMNNFSEAEYYYREAIRVAPTDKEAYQNLADLYQFKLKKSTDDVLKIYEEGLKATNSEASLFLNHCSLLRKTDHVKEAIECYTVLSTSFPKNEQFKQVLEDLKNKK
jgi:tetratricopeptide (TPR) repeat protein